MGRKKTLLGNVLLIFAIGIWIKYPANAAEPSVSAKSAVLMIGDSGSIIYAKDENRPMPMASTTKIMTALLTLEEAQACGNREIEITDEMVRVEGTSMGLMAGDIVNLKTLAKGMLLCSGNDAANASAIAVSGDRAKFISLMNDKAKQIGMKNTVFVTPSGLDSSDHHSTAYDMAVLGSYAMDNDEFKQIASKKSDKVTFISPAKTVTIKNHNKLLRLYDGCIGIKTGFTKSAGRCLVSCAEKNGVRLVAVTLNAPNDWDDHIGMYNYGFENTEGKTFDDRQMSASIRVRGGEVENIDVLGATFFSATLKKGDLGRVQREVELPEYCDAPVGRGQIVGKVVYYLDGRMIGRNDIIAGIDVAEKKDQRNIIQKIVDFLKKIFGK